MSSPKAKEAANSLPQNSPAGSLALASPFESLKPIHIVSIITFLSLVIYFQALNYGLVNFDDTGYITNNKIIHSLSPASLHQVFSRQVMGNYHPLTVLSYALEYALQKDNPFIYHLDNLLLHILVSVLVFFFLLRLTANKTVSTITAIFFAIHPMHVESVAWVADRKDLLYTFFFLASCIAYVKFSGKAERFDRKWYAACFLLFVAALLAKAVAVCLPVVLLLIDYYKRRPLNMRVWAEKIPFFLVSLISGYGAFKAQHAIHAINIAGTAVSGIERLDLACYALLLYIKQLLLPFNQVCLYIYPIQGNGHLPTYFSLYTILCLAGMAAFIYYLRKDRRIMFGFMFFMVTIFSLLQLVPVGYAIVADRYTYLPYLGLFIILAIVYQFLLANKGTRKLAMPLLAMHVAVLTICAYLQVTIWKDDISLWTRSVDVYAKDPFSLNQLGSSYVQHGIAAAQSGDKAGAAESLNKSLQYLGNADKLERAQDKPSPEKISEICNNLGLAYANTGNRDSAFFYFEKAVAANPQNLPIYANRAREYVATGNYAKALEDYKTYIRLAPGSDEAYYMAGACSGMLNDFTGSLNYFNKAIELAPGQAQYYTGRAKAYQHLGNKSAADADRAKAAELQ